jgi:hypothetical protein
MSNSNSEVINIKSVKDKLSLTKSNLSTLVPTDKCQRSLIGLYFVLFILIISMVGTVIQEGRKGRKEVSWILFSLSLLMGLVIIFVMIKVKKYKKIYISILSVFITIMNMVAMILCSPDISARQLVTPHFFNIVFGIVGVLSALYNY